MSDPQSNEKEVQGIVEDLGVIQDKLRTTFSELGSIGNKIRSLEGGDMVAERLRLYVSNHLPILISNESGMSGINITIENIKEDLDHLIVDENYVEDEH